VTEGACPARTKEEGREEVEGVDGHFHVLRDLGLALPLCGAAVLLPGLVCSEAPRRRARRGLPPANNQRCRVACGRAGGLKN